MCFSSNFRLLCNRAVMVSSAKMSQPIWDCIMPNCLAMCSCKRRKDVLTNTSAPFTCLNQQLNFKIPKYRHKVRASQKYYCSDGCSLYRLIEQMDVWRANESCFVSHKDHLLFMLLPQTNSLMSNFFHQFMTYCHPDMNTLKFGTPGSSDSPPGSVAIPCSKAETCIGREHSSDQTVPPVVPMDLPHLCP